jgi:hypothetical protein
MIYSSIPSGSLTSLAFFILFVCPVTIGLICIAWKMLAVIWYVVYDIYWYLSAIANVALTAVRQA